MDRHLLPPSGPTTPGSVRTHVLAALAAVVAAASLAGCGVRLESPTPPEPSPDELEQVRGRTVQDALDLAAAAAEVAEAGGPEPVLVVLEDVRAFSARHAEELGGVYDSGLPEPTGSPSPTAATALPSDVPALLEELVGDAGRAAADADAVPEGRLARLVASVAVARDGLADRLAAAAAVARPPVAATVQPTPGSAGTDPTTSPGTPAAQGAAQEPSPLDAPAPDTAAAADVALVHDEAAWTFTVLAARAADAPRAALLEAARLHRAASDAWAAAAGVVGTPSDPRRAAYALPPGLDDPAVAEALPRSLEQAVAVASANAVAGAPAGARATAVESLRVATAAATARGAAPVPFPGMPELAAEPVR